MAKAIFVTGTNTGVGKTVVAAALVRLAARHGLKTVGLKPVASGSERSGPQGALRNADALELQAAASVALSYEWVNPYCFEPPIAPHIAAREAGSPVMLPDLLDWYRKVTADVDLAVIEGAGGWRVPLYPAGFFSDLPETLGLGVVLVVGMTLGCLNHARLTAEAIKASSRSTLLGWIANDIDPNFARAEANLETLSDLLDGPPLARVAHSEARRSAFGNPSVDLPDHPPLLTVLGIRSPS